MIAALLAAMLALPAAAAPYDDAKAAYDAGNFDQAASAFAALVAAHPSDAALRYDLGNALLKAGKLGRASASYQRAFDLDPRDGDGRHNLDFVLKRSGEELAPPGIPGPAFAAFTALSSRELAGLHWLAAWATSILAGLALPGRRTPRAAPGLAARRGRGLAAVRALVGGLRRASGGARRHHRRTRGAAQRPRGEIHRRLYRA